MNKPVTSEFGSYYFVKLICIGIIYSFIFGYPLYSVLEHGGPYKLYKRILLIVLCLTFIIVFINKFLKDLKKFTITDEYIRVKYYLSQKELIIRYPEIRRMSTTRASGDGEKYNDTKYQNFTIEFGNNQSICFNGTDYINYDNIKNAIYRHKLKPE